eukprot:s1454_g5.t1
MAGIKYLLKTLQGVELTGLFVHQGKCRLYGRLLLTTVELEQLKKNWTIQAQNLPHPKDAKVVTRFSSSLGTIASAVSYTAEALSQSGKVLEAKTLVTSFGEKTFCKAVQQQVNFIAEQERNHNAPSSTMLSTTVMYEQRADKKEEGLYEGCHNSLLSNQQPTTNLGGITPPSFSINCASAAHQGKERDAKDAKGENDREKTKEPRDHSSPKPAEIDLGSA